MNQDGLENFFGCLRSCCQNRSSLIAIHFRSAYATTFVNNLASAHSIKSNCEPDFSKPLLTDMQELFLNDKCKESEEINDKEKENDCDLTSNLNCSKNDGYEYDYDPISVNIQISAKEIDSINSIRDQALANASNVVCDKLLQVTKCQKCRETLETTAFHDSQNTANFPSTLFIKNFTNVVNAINIILPSICEQKLLKKKLLKYIDDDIDVEQMGCSKHYMEVELKFKDYCSVYGILTFCKNINDLLSGKNQNLARDCNIIEESAHKFYQKKKHIGKHSEVSKVQN